MNSCGINQLETVHECSQIGITGGFPHCVQSSIRVQEVTVTGQEIVRHILPLDRARLAAPASGFIFNGQIREWYR